MAHIMPDADPKKIEKLTMAAYPTFAMLAGMQLAVFASLGEDSLTAGQIAEATGAEAERLRPLLYALVAAELLTVEGDRFSNTPEALQFLIPGSPTYMGDHACFNVDPLVISWGLSGGLNTAETIRTGMPQCTVDFSTMSEEEVEKGFRGTLSIATRAGRELAARYDLAPYHSLLDVGGGIGGLSIAVTEACPHLRATVLDLPQVAPIATRIVEEAGAAERVRVMAADVIRDSLPGSYDLAVLRALIQVLPPGAVPLALENVRGALKPGGAIYVLGHILDNSRTSPLAEVWYSTVNINFHDIPGSYTEQEYRDWLTGAGLVPLELSRLPNGDGVIVARKPV